eukprot:scaffold2292_cov301-Pavlova_lutheri.AAC.17
MAKNANTITTCTIPCLDGKCQVISSHESTRSVADLFGSGGMPAFKILQAVKVNTWFFFFKSTERNLERPPLPCSVPLPPPVFEASLGPFQQWLCVATVAFCRVPPRALGGSLWPPLSAASSSPALSSSVPRGPFGFAAPKLEDGPLRAQADLVHCHVWVAKQRFRMVQHCFRSLHGAKLFHRPHHPRLGSLAFRPILPRRLVQRSPRSMDRPSRDLRRVSTFLVLRRKTSNRPTGAMR